MAINSFKESTVKHTILLGPTFVSARLKSSGRHKGCPYAKKQPLKSYSADNEVIYSSIWLDICRDCSAKIRAASRTLLAV